MFFPLIIKGMENWIEELFYNKPLWLTVFAWAIAQGLKISGGLIRERRFDFVWILRTGGMPSAHSAAVSTLAFAVGRELGFFSPMFALAVMFALITMFDAQTWRRSIGVKAKILNRMMEDIHRGQKVSEEKLRELVGHSPIEVLVGASIGLLVGFIAYL